MMPFQGLMARGLLERERGEWRVARAAFMEAAMTAPDGASSATAETHAALCGLALGMPGSWEQFEQRLRAPALPSRPFARGENYWDGSTVSSLLIWAEGGRGNTIQFSRYVEDVAARLVVPITFAVQPELVELITGVGLVNDDVEVCALGLGDASALAPGNHGAHCSVLSLPAIFAAKEWRSPMFPVARTMRRRVPLRVGLWWQGNPDYWDDARRSGTRAMYAPLEALIPRVSFVDLQAPAVVMNGGAPWQTLRDFAAETVVALDEVDLVITTDTAMVHLAGALGVPTWLVLHRACNWRWAVDGPAVVGPLMYGSVRIFRAPSDGGARLAGVVARDVLPELARLVGVDVLSGARA